MSVHRTFIDTNVLLYSLDDADILKRDIAREIVGNLCNTGKGHISTQVLNECASNLIRKFRRTPEEVSALCANLSDFTIEVGSLAQVQEALRIMATTSISFWDACIVSSAKLSGCKDILTEDLATGQILEGLRIINPFR